MHLPGVKRLREATSLSARESNPIELPPAASAYPLHWLSRSPSSQKDTAKMLMSSRPVSELRSVEQAVKLDPVEVFCEVAEIIASNISCAIESARRDSVESFIY